MIVIKDIASEKPVDELKQGSFQIIEVVFTVVVIAGVFKWSIIEKSYYYQIIASALLCFCFLISVLTTKCKLPLISGYIKVKNLNFLPFVFATLNRTGDAYLSVL